MHSNLEPKSAFEEMQNDCPMSHIDIQYRQIEEIIKPNSVEKCKNKGSTMRTHQRCILAIMHDSTV